MRFQLRRYDLVSSTNELAVELARQGASEGTVVVAGEQRGGHGRMQRRWESPPGGLWFTLILRPRVEPCRAAQVTLLAGVAVARALRSLYRTDRIRIKWPNDILLDGRKVCGILSEMRLDEPGGIEYAVVGVGVNVAIREEDLAEDLRAAAASLNAVFEETRSCDEVLYAILNEISALYEIWQTRDAEVILPMWRALNCTLGETVSVWDEGRPIFEGTAVAVDDAGALLVRDRAGAARSFDFGEITIRPTK